MTQVVAGDGGTTTLTYDDSGFLASITEPGDRVIAVSQSITNGVADLTQLVDAAGYTRTFGYDGANHITSDAWDPYDTAFTYDSSTGLLSEVDLGSGSTYTIVSAATEALQSDVAIESTQASQATITNGLDNTTIYDLGASGQIAEEISPAGATQVWEYNSQDLLTAYVDADGNQTSYGYDSFGQLTNVTDPDGDSTTYYRDGTFYDNVTETIQSPNITTTSAYDSLGELTQSVDGDGYTTTYVWANNRMVSQTDPDGDVTTYAYDSALRLTETIDPDGDITTTTYFYSCTFALVMAVGFSCNESSRLLRFLCWPAQEVLSSIRRTPP